MTRIILTALNLWLLVLFPLAWSAPLMRAGLLPIFGLSEISLLSGIASLWPDEPGLAVLIAVFALLVPMLKTLGLALVHMHRAPAKWLPAITTLGKLAMADIFLIAIYITLVKGIGLATVEAAWGLWLFTGCVLASLAIGLTTSALAKREALG